LYSLFLLGNVTLEGPSGPVTGHAAQRRQLAFLALLATAGEAGRSRDKIQAFLWPESSIESARHSLADTLYRLRKALGEGCVLGTGESLRLNPRVVLNDIHTFETSLDRGELEEAVELYRGPFLDGFHLRASNDFEDWRNAEARRIGQRFEGALEELAGRAEAEREFQNAVGFWERLSAHDPLNTRFRIGWMEALAAAGDPGNAIQLGEDHARLLEEDLGAQAPSELLVLLERLRKGDGTTIRPAGSDGIAKGDGSFPFEGKKRGSHPIPSPVFVGRESELARLHHSLDQALAGEGCVAFITGEAGTGKTALATEFCRRAAEAHPDLVFASGNGNAHTGLGDPYLPFREILALLTGDVESRYAGGSISQDYGARLWNLIPVSVGALLEVGPDLIDTILNRARLYARVSTFARHDPDRAGPLASLQEEARTLPGPPAQHALFLQFVRTLRAVARAHPVLLVLDDLQWADSGSLGLLFQLGRQLQGSRILVLGLFRPSDVALGREGARHPLEPVVNELKSSFGEVEIPLGEGGDPALVDAMVDAEPNALGPEFRGTLFEQTRGHALFTTELLRSMRDGGMLVRDEEDLWIEDASLRWDILPGRIDAVIGERVGRLPPGMQRILTIASVEGEEFTLEAIARVQGVDVRDLIEPVSRDLERRHRLVVAQGFRRVDGQRLSVYRFRHILFQRFLYDRLDEVERAHFHEQLGTALEAVHGGHTEEIALKLAHHFRAARMLDKAAMYLLSAGKQALRAAAYPEAIAHFESSLAFLLTLPASTERDARELDTQLALGNARHLALAPGQEDAFQRARQLAEELGDAPHLGWALRGLYVVNHYAGNHRETGRLAERMLTIAEEEGNRTLLVYAHEAAGRSAGMRGELRGSLHHYQTLLSLYDPDKHIDPIHLAGVEAGSVATGMIALAKLPLGYPTQAVEWSRDAQTLARERKSAVALTYVLLYDVLIHLERRDVETAMAQIEAWRAANAAVGMTTFWGPYADLCEGRCRSQMGGVKEGIRLTKTGLNELLKVGVGIWIPCWTAWVAQALSMGGRTEEGLRILDEARANPVAKDERWGEPDVLQIRGDLLLALPQPNLSEAEVSYCTAIDLARDQEAKWCELRATTSLARLLQTQGRADEARTMLREIYDWFTEGFDTPDLKEAAALLAELKGDG